MWVGRAYLRRAAEGAGLSGERLAGGVSLQRRRVLVGSTPAARGGGRGGASRANPLVVVLDKAEGDGLPCGVCAVGKRRVLGDLHLVVGRELNDFAAWVERVRRRRRWVRVELLEGRHPARLFVQAALAAAGAVVLRHLPASAILPSLGASRVRHVHMDKDVLSHRPATAAGLGRVQNQRLGFL